MIKSVVSNSEYIKIHSNYQKYVSGNGDFAGSMRFNTKTQSIEVFDGNYWVEITNTVSLDHSEHFTKLIKWVEEQMSIDSKYLQLSQQHDSVKNAYEKYIEAKKQLDCIVQLIA
jgi:hypothetical protein